MDAMEDAKLQRSPQKVKDYDNDLRRVRQMQQLQAEQDAKIRAKELKEKKAAEVVPEKKEKKKPKPPSTTSTSTSKPGSNLTMNNFSTPSYRCVSSFVNATSFLVESGLNAWNIFAVCLD